MAATDVLTAQSNIGSTSMQLLPEELYSMGSFYYDNSANVASIINTQQLIQSVVFSPAANRSVVKQFMSLKGSTSRSEIAQKVLTQKKQVANLERVAQRGLSRGVTKR